MKVSEWFEKNKYKSDSFRDIKNLVKIKKERKLSISVIIPTLNEEASVGNVINKLSILKKKKLVDEIIVIDSGSTDNTKEVAKEAGADFYYSADLLKRHKEIKGKGENLWKSLYVAKGDIICWVDADIKNIHPRFVYGLVGPLLTNKKLMFTKAFYQRPIRVGNELAPLGGGRVTELLVRPLFNMYFPILSGFIQPLSGEYAGKRYLLERIPFFTGYGVETAMLIDIQRRFGLKVCAQVDLKKRVHRNQTIESLSRMSFGILGVFARRANQMGKFISMGTLRKQYNLIQHSQEGEYKLKKHNITDRQRPPMITINEYRKKFKKDPKWLDL
jgi:glucosyl-3-phosphoglycerate synthase